MLIFGAIFSGGNVQYELAVQNKDGSDVSVAFINAVNSTNAFKVHMVNASENADTYIKSNRISGMLIIPQGFGDNVQRNLALGQHDLLLLYRSIPRRQVQRMLVRSTRLALAHSPLKRRATIVMLRRPQSY